MTRPVSGTTTTAIGQPITKPILLLELGFPVPVRLSTGGAITWNSLLWSSASVRVSMPAGGAWTVDIVNESYSLGQTALAHGTAGRTAKLWQLYGDGPYAVDDAEQLLDGEMGAADIGPVSVRIGLKRRAPQRTPRIYFRPPTFNFLPPDGLIITTGAATTTLTTKKRSLSPYGATRG